MIRSPMRSAMRSAMRDPARATGGSGGAEEEDDMATLVSSFTHTDINGGSIADSDDHFVEIGELPAGAIPLSITIRCRESVDGAALGVPLLVTQGDGYSLVPLNGDGDLTPASAEIGARDQVYHDYMRTDRQMSGHVAPLDAAKTLYLCFRNWSDRTAGEWDIVITYTTAADIPAYSPQDPVETAINNSGGYDEVGQSWSVDDASVFFIGDVINPDGNSELLLITGISSNTLTVSRGYLGTTAESVVDNQVITRVTAPLPVE